MEDSNDRTAVFDTDILTSPVSASDIQEYLKAHPAKKIHISPVLKWMVIILGGVLVIGLLAILIFAGGAVSFSNIILTIVVVVGVVLAIRWMNTATLRDSERTIRMTRFAEANGMQYTPEQTFMKGPGMYFQVGIERTGTDIFSGVHDGWPFEFGNYVYNTGLGREGSISSIGYIKIGLDHPLPHIVLDGQLNNASVLGFDISNLPIDYKSNQKLDLEGDFNQYFQLYVPQGYERDALYIFTPDLMAVFIDQLTVCDVEIVDNWLYAYHESFDMDNPVQYEKLFPIIDAVGKKMTLRAARYHDDRTTGGLEKTLET